MNENKLIKLLDLALERIEALESAEVLESDENYEIIERENEGFRRTIEELESECNKLRNCFDKTYCESRELMRENELLMVSAKEKDAAIFELKEQNEMLVRSKEGKLKWVEIIDPTRRPKVNEQVLVTTKIGKVTIAYFGEDGKVRTQIGGKDVQVLAWMPLPRAYDAERQ